MTPDFPQKCTTRHPAAGMGDFFQSPILFHIPTSSRYVFARNFANKNSEGYLPGGTAWFLNRHYSQLEDSDK